MRSCPAVILRSACLVLFIAWSPSAPWAQESASYTRGVSLIEQGKYNEALDALTQAIAENPTIDAMPRADKPLAWLHGEVKTPPFSAEARLEAGVLLRKLQRGERLDLPHSRPMPGIGPRCHELRIQDADVTWRIIYRVDPDAVIISEVFVKKTQATPRSVIESSRRRLNAYDRITRG